MSALEFPAFFDRPCRACLFVSRNGGPPEGWPFIMKLVDGELWCTTYQQSAKMPKVRASDQATCLVFEDERTMFPYTVVDGVVREVQPTPELIGRWFGAPPSDPRGHRVVDRLLAGKRVFLVVQPLRVRSWTNADG